MLGTLKHPTAASLDATAIIEAHFGHEAEAEAAYSAALAAETAPMLWHPRSGTLTNLAILQLRRGEAAESRANATQSAQISLAHHDLTIASSAYAQLAEIASYQKDGTEALRSADEALRLAREAQHPQIVANALVTEATPWRRRGRMPRPAKATPRPSPWRSPSARMRPPWARSWIAK